MAVIATPSRDGQGNVIGVDINKITRKKMLRDVVVEMVNNPDRYANYKNLLGKSIYGESIPPIPSCVAFYGWKDEAEKKKNEVALVKCCQRNLRDNNITDKESFEREDNAGTFIHGRFNK